MSDDKKKFRVIGIDHHSMAQRASEVEQELNSLISSGYRVIQIVNEPVGTMLIGEYIPPAPPPQDFSSFLSGLFRDAQQPVRSPFTMDLMRRLLDVGPTDDMAVLEKAIAPVTKEASAGLLRESAKEMQDESDAHARAHGDAEPCWVAKRLSDGAKIVSGLADSATN